MNTHLQASFEFLLPNLWRASWQACVLAGVVLLAQGLLRSRLSGRARYTLWGLVILRLLMPVVPQSRVSVFNLTHWSRADGVVQPTAHPDSVDLRVGPEEENRATPQAAETHAAAESRAAPQTSARPTLLSVLGCIWIAGIVVLSLRVAWVCRGLSRLLRGLAVVDDTRVAHMIEDCAGPLRLSRLPKVLTGDDVSTPAVVGIFRPALLLPARVLHAFDPAVLALMVLHELAHLQRADVRARWVR